MISRAILSGLFGAGLLMSASPALATPDLPEVVQETLDMDCVPQCVLCHRTPAGGIGTLNEDFGGTLFFEGQFAEPDAAALPTALSNVEMLGSDSDGDTVPDIDELRQGRDPNVSGAGNLCGPRYGCGARIAPQSGPDSLGALSAGIVAAALAFAMRRSRRR